MVNDSDSDDPDSFLAENSNEQVKLQRKKIKRKAKRCIARTKSEQRLLKRKLPKAVSSVLSKFPKIRNDMEVFVRSRRVGADAWRRTGVLTFDGSIKTGPKVTFKRIQQHMSWESYAPCSL